MNRSITSLILLTACAGFLLNATAEERMPYQPQRDLARKAAGNGNHLDAYKLFASYICKPDVNPRLAAEDATQALYALASINRDNESDAFRERLVKAHPASWQVLKAVAESYQNANHSGFMVAGEFERGPHRGGGEQAHSSERDRVRAMQLMAQCIPLLEKEPSASTAGSVYLQFAATLLQGRDHNNAWKLNALTDTSTLPDYEPGYPYGYYGSTTRGAPVDAEGHPVFHAIPESYASAATDGERWRWLLSRAMELHPSYKEQVAWTRANFLHQQFGVQTLADYGWYFYRPRNTEEDRAQDTSGTYELHTLTGNETIARLANGIHRITLPDEFNFLRIFQELADNDGGGFQENAIHSLAQIAANRRQYPAAADAWRTSIRKFGPGHEKYKQKQLDQIIGNWGQFETTVTQPAGAGAVLQYKFRNGHKIRFTAHRIRVDQLLDDVKAYLDANPVQLDWQKVQIENLGYRLVQENQTKYLGAKVADWQTTLNPAPDHFDQRIDITTPLQDAGAYLVTAEMEDGNTSTIVVWLNDTVIAKKPLSSAENNGNQRAFYFVADARSGAPIARANVEFFGYWQENLQQRRGKRYADIRTARFAEFSDANGQVFPSTHDLFPNGRQAQWIAIATTEDGRFSFHGFSSVWHGDYHDQQYNQTKAYGITDRPVYRPDQTLNFKWWIRHARYDQADTSDFANQSFSVVIHNPRGDEVFSKSYQADDYGGVNGEYLLPDNAQLGVYTMHIPHIGQTTFRVEEYKKPEFEVVIEAPDEPVMLGEEITATIIAKYYFGAPVTEGKVSYKITRTAHRAEWYPPAPWDWFYGPGYWWFGNDYEWYPGWHRWGCIRPFPFWYPQDRTPPEIVAEAEVPVGEDGTIEVTIDTGLAKAVHGDQDHRYQITAEVTDASRRTIVGQGEVLVARKPFRVYAWVDRGHYTVGEVVHANFTAHTLDQKPVAADGHLTLYSITYDDDRKPIETAVQEWELPTDPQGQSRQQIKATRAGQYRLSYSVTDQADHTIEGGYLFVVRGQGDDGKDYRFNHLELVADQPDYAPGDEVKLMINTDRPGSTVLLFVRPSNGVYLKPEILRLKGKSTVHTISIRKKDMPNFFVEAITVSDGKVYTELREIVVPPEKRVLNVDVLPSAESYLPGQSATVQLKVTDFDGNPFFGSTVMSVYDKAVEYISGGSNVPGIRDFFWKWRRTHTPQTEHNLERRTGNLPPKGDPGMQPLGVFGRSVADEVGRYRLEGNMLQKGGMARSMRGDADGLGMAAAPMVAMESMAGFDDNAQMKEAGGEAAPALVEPTVRSEFADTAFWTASLQTDESGIAEVTFDMPENLTGWKIRTWALGHGTRVGEGETLVVTAKNLLLRLQAPRFFVEKDEVVLSANIHNYLENEKEVQAILELDGTTVEPMGGVTQQVTIAANGEARVDWRVKVVREGEITVRMKALTDEESDAMQMTFPVYVHGMLKTDSFSAALRPEQTSGEILFQVPADRRPDASRLEIRYSPTLAGALVDALPYLVEYPYGCTEQTLSRFLPTVLTQKILRDMGVDLKAIRDKQTNLNAQEIGEDVDRAKQWKRYDRNPVFDEDTVNEMVRDGLKALYDFQLSDGGWGWFSGYGERSWPHTTAYVVHGLQLARANDLAILPDAMQRGVQWLKRYQKEQVREINDPDKGKRYADELDAFVCMVLVDADEVNHEMLEFLYRDRNHLAVYAKAMFGMTLDRLGMTQRRDMLVQNIEQHLIVDDENQTAYLNLPNEDYWWYWYGSEYEAQAYYLKLLARTDPKSPKAGGLVKYLLNNRKHATYWSSTRDTAICIEAMAEYLRASGEDKPDLTIEILIDGKPHKEVKVTAENLFTFDNKLVLEGEALTSGEHTIELRKSGTGPLYANAYLTVFSLEDYIPKAGLEIQVDRRYYRLHAVDKTVKVAGARGQAVGQKVEKYERELLADLSELTSGDLIEVELVLESKNDYEYLVFEDMKPAGFEPVDVRSGYTGNALGAYVAFRDERVVFFVRRLARGTHSVTYRTRAEIPGRFSALPTRGYAMYAPELKANSAEIKLVVEDE